MFSLLALPRSGTAWASVWLGATHDPLDRYFAKDVVELEGICCTASWLFPKILKARSGPRVLLDRPLDQIQNSLKVHGLGSMPDTTLELWNKVEGPRFKWTDLWENPEPIWSTLKPGIPFDKQRHKELSRLRIEIDESKWYPMTQDFKDWM